MRSHFCDRFFRFPWCGGWHFVATSLPQAARLLAPAYGPRIKVRELLISPHSEGAVKTQTGRRGLRVRREFLWEPFLPSSK